METVLSDDRWVYLLIGVVVAALYIGRWYVWYAGSSDVTFFATLAAILVFVPFLYPIVIFAEVGAKLARWSFGGEQ